MNNRCPGCGRFMRKDPFICVSGTDVNVNSGKDGIPVCTIKCGMKIALLDNKCRVEEERSEILLEISRETSRSVSK